MPVGTRSAFQLDQFKKSVLSGAGLARTNRFEVMITAPSGLAGQGSSAGIVSLYAEQASLPPINVTIRPYKIFGPTHQKPTSIEYGGEGIPVTFHVDRDMKIKNFFEDWCHMVVNPNSFEVSYQKDYISTVIIRQNNEQENTTYEVELLEAFPRSMNLMELNHASSNQTHRLTVIFAYRYWKSKVYGGSKVDTQATPQLRSQQNPQVPKPSFEEAPIPRYFGGLNPGGELGPGVGGSLPVAA